MFASLADDVVPVTIAHRQLHRDLPIRCPTCRTSIWGGAAGLSAKGWKHPRAFMHDLSGRELAVGQIFVCGTCTAESERLQRLIAAVEPEPPPPAAMAEFADYAARGRLRKAKIAALQAARPPQQFSTMSDRYESSFSTFTASPSAQSLDPPLPRACTVSQTYLTLQSGCPSSTRRSASHVQRGSVSARSACACPSRRCNRSSSVRTPLLSCAEALQKYA